MKMWSEREQKAEATKEMLYNVTRRMLADYDLKYVTIRNICEEANVTHGAFYYHFKSKQDILFACGKDSFEKFLADNPAPDTFDHDDFIKMIVWPAVAYGYFCRCVGLDFMKYLYNNCEDDIFDVVCFEDIEQRIVAAVKAGYIGGTNDIDTLLCDVRIIFTSIIRQWICSEKTRSECNMELMELLWRLPQKFIRSFTGGDYTFKLRKIPERERNKTYVQAFGLDQFEFDTKNIWIRVD